ncbi:hypothetical protein FRC14_004981 [Serendipita sp. 396]|nr:hypothetical protein FRC14_004981 [Serendipita sp. 396]KAG8821119.1 hypothetical protein FRC19_008237 [Serendipita sp. 401]
MSTNHRMSTIPGLRTSAASAMTQDGILAKRREYIALCAIAEQSAYLAKTLTATAQQQALMTDGGAGKRLCLRLRTKTFDDHPNSTLKVDE